MQEEIETCLAVLKRGGTIAYPTDTIWGLGCDATNEQAIDKLYNLKNRPSNKAFVCLVSDVGMLNKYIPNVPEVAYTIIDLSDTPTTIVYDKPVGLPPNLTAPDNTLAIRVVKDPFCKSLIQHLRRPIVSTSANFSGSETPKCFKEIDSEILKLVDHSVNLRRDAVLAKSSSIIKISADSTVRIIRK